MSNSVENMADNSQNNNAEHAEIQPKLAIEVDLDQFGVLVAQSMKFDIITREKGKEQKITVGLAELKAIIDDIYFHAENTALLAVHNLRMGLDVKGRYRKGQNKK
jgi:uncharacterized protein YqfB (UPF0267 family)